MIARPCTAPRCAAFALTGARHCATHAPAARALATAATARKDEQRGTAAQRGYTRTWAHYARALRARFPLSIGYLTRTAYWTPQHAAVFHAAREAAHTAGRTLEFHRALAAPRPHLITGLCATLAAIPPIYDFHPSPAPEPAEEVDHIIPAAGPADPLFSPAWNHQVLSKRQHSEKTARYDGGFRGTHTITTELP